MLFALRSKGGVQVVDEAVKNIYAVLAHLEERFQPVPVSRLLYTAEDAEKYRQACCS